MAAYSNSKINNHHSTIIHPAMEKPQAMAISPAPNSGQKAKKARSIAPCLDVSFNAYPL
jgi:hypothetical protein